MATAQTLFDLIAADPVLFPPSGPSLVGTYAVPGQTVRPALAVWMANERLPERTVVTGVAVTIMAVPDGAEEWYLTSEVSTNYLYRIYAAQWSTGAGASAALQAVRNRLLQLLPGARSSAIPAGTLEGVGVLDQVVITWSDVDGILQGAG